jgi:hypothetical protein
MRSSIIGFWSSLLLGTLAAVVQAQSVALPLDGEGELAMDDSVQDVRRGSVLLQADSSVKVVVLESGTPRTLVAGKWRLADRSTAELSVQEVLGSDSAHGAGEIRFRPDGSVGHLAARGRVDGREFTLHFENGVSIAMADSESPAADSAGYETGALPPRRPGPPARDDTFPWGGDWAVVDAVRHGEGRLTDPAGREERFDRARLILGDNDEFLLVLDGNSRAEVAGTWEGDPRSSPVRLKLREAMGEKMGGVGRAWLRDRSWDRDWSFQRVELNGWSDERGDTFTLYFEAEQP